MQTQPTNDARTLSRLGPRARAFEGARAFSILNSQFSIRQAFTLVELMVVVGIIGLLIAIVVPAINSARQQAKVTATSATIRAIDTGAEAFRAESRFGGSYPPSWRIQNDISSPETGSSKPPEYQVGGANFIVWATAGADLLGTPGFRDLNGVPPNADYRDWAQWIDDTSPDPATGLYGINPSTGQPVQPRAEPYVSIDKMKFPKHIAPDQYQITMESGTVPLDAICFLDNFDQPILYYRATRNAPRIVTDYQAVDVKARPVAAGIYSMDDNSHITGSDENGLDGKDFGAGGTHFAGDPKAQLGDPTMYPGDSVPGSFIRTVWNPEITATWRPHRPDSFILLSAGPDGLYGTADDIGNFPINK